MSNISSTVQVSLAPHGITISFMRASNYDSAFKGNLPPTLICPPTARHIFSTSANRWRRVVAQLISRIQTLRKCPKLPITFKNDRERLTCTFNGGGSNRMWGSGRGAAAHRLPTHHNNRIPYAVNISV